MHRTVTTVEKIAFQELDVIARSCKNKQERTSRYEMIRNRQDGDAVLQKLLEVMNAEWLVKARQVERELDSLHVQMPANPSDEDTINSIWTNIQALKADKRLQTYSNLTNELDAFIREKQAKPSSVNSGSFRRY